MIHVNREQVDKPAILDSEKAHTALQLAEEFFATSQKQRGQQRFDFGRLVRLYKEHAVKDTLNDLFLGKCAFCESVVTDGSMDLFRPKGGSMNLDGTFDPDHYWWLTIEWSNLYLCCQACNMAKANRFPVNGKRATKGMIGSDLLVEEPLLLDPCEDFPADHLIFQKDGSVISRTEKGQVTIEVFNLNRAALRSARKQTFELTEAIWKTIEQTIASDQSSDSVGQLLENMIQPRTPYLGLVRQYVAQWLRSLPIQTRDLVHPKWRTIVDDITGQHRVTNSLKRKVAKEFEIYSSQLEEYSIETEENESLERYYTRLRLIKRIEIKNFKIIKELKLELKQDIDTQIPWYVLLGENGTGKSSVLQAIALALAGVNECARLEITPNDVLRHRCQKGYIRVYFSGVSEPTELIFNKGATTFEGSSTDSRFILLGYGATRLLPRKNMEQVTTDQFVHIHNLFDPFIPLVDAADWLSKLHSRSRSEFNNIAHALKDLLSLDDESRILVQSGEVVVKAFGTTLSLHQLSDGYQSVLALTVDIMSSMLRRWELMDLAEGFVIIDEIGAHLHPQWQMEIVSSLRQVFPRVQFLISTHSPLCLRGLQTGEVVLLRRSMSDDITVVVDLPEIKGLFADQLLTSEYFGLSSTLEPEINKKFTQYYELLALHDLTSEQTVLLENLKTELEKYRVMGRSQRERLALEAADEYLAEERQGGNEKRLDSLKTETNAKIKSIWKQVNMGSED